MLEMIPSIKITIKKHKDCLSNVNKEIEERCGRIANEMLPKRTLLKLQQQKMRMKNYNHKCPLKSFEAVTAMAIFSASFAPI